MKKSIAFAFSIVCSATLLYGQQDSVMMEKIYHESMFHGKAYDDLRHLTKDIGHRIAGSPRVEKAVSWSKELMETLPFDRVYLQDVTVPYWDRGSKEEAYIIGTNEKLEVLALGGSVGTPAEGLTANVVEIEYLSELKDHIDEIPGKIVFVNKPWDESIVETGVAYGLNSSQRSRGPAEVAKYGGIAYLFRSLSSSTRDDFPHTGGTRYTAGIDSIPAMAISAIGAENLSQVLQTNPAAKVFLKQQSKWKGNVPSHNVIAEWKGSEKPEEIITIGGHIDSWDVGEGAHDNGTGTMGTLDAIRTLMNLGYKPKRTIRLIFYMNEENGVQGAIKYGEDAIKNKETIVAAIESDAGGFAPRGFDIKASKDAVNWIQNAWKPLFEDKYWVSRFLQGSPGIDSGIWGEHFPNTVMFNFRPDPHRYFDIHHTAKDVFEAVDRRELQSGVAAIASLLYLVDQHLDRIPK